MKHPNAGCSQQALVLMEILKRKHYSYRKVGFPHHYAIEVKVNGNWYFFDPNMEPYMNLKQRLHESWNASDDCLKKYYDTTKHKNLSWQFGNGQTADFGPVNEIPAQRLNFFQKTTGMLSKILWCFPLLFLFVKNRISRKHPLKVAKSIPGLNSNHNPAFALPSIL